MPDVKISALPAAGALTGTEPVPIVQSAATCITTVQDIANLNGAGGVWVTPAAGLLAWFNVALDSFVKLTDTGSFQVQGEAVIGLVSNVAGVQKMTFTMDQLVNQQTLISCIGGFSFRFEIASSGYIEGGVGGTNVLTIQGWNLISFQYSPGTPGNWVPAATDVWLALDRLAAQVAILIAGPIP